MATIIAKNTLSTKGVKGDLHLNMWSYILTKVLYFSKGGGVVVLQHDFHPLFFILI
jgi:hypothetical protein